MARIPSREYGISQQLQQLARQVEDNKDESEDAWLVFRLVSVGSYVRTYRNGCFVGDRCGTASNQGLAHGIN